MDRDARNLLTGLGFAVLTCNSALAIYRSKHDHLSVAFILSAYIALLLLFRFLRLYKRAAGQNNAADQRGKYKLAIWMLTTYLTGMFAYSVAVMMPWPVDMVVWGMAATAVFGGFYAFFIYGDR